MLVNIVGKRLPTYPFYNIARQRRSIVRVRRQLTGLIGLRRLTFFDAAPQSSCTTYVKGCFVETFLVVHEVKHGYWLIVFEVCQNRLGRYFIMSALRSSFPSSELHNADPDHDFGRWPHSKTEFVIYRQLLLLVHIAKVVLIGEYCCLCVSKTDIYTTWRWFFVFLVSSPQFSTDLVMRRADG